MSSTPRDVLFAADVAVRAALTAAGKMVRHKRGRANRALTPRCAPAAFYLVARPPINTTELADIAAASPAWWIPLRETLTVLGDDPQIVDRIVTVCDLYLRDLLAAQQPHSVFDLRKYLDQAYAVTAE